MDPISVAVVGAGYWGPNLIRNFHSSPATRVAWVVDADPDRAARAAVGVGDARTSTTLDRALEDPTVEAVAIATPPATHASLALAAIEAGRHVLVEKPLAATVAEGRMLTKAANAAGVVLMADHTYCYTSVVDEIRRIVHSGELGDFYYFDSVRVNLGLVQSEVDVFWDLAPHDLSILDFVLPPDVSIATIAARGSDPLGVGHPCVGYFAASLSNGGSAHAHLNWLSPSKVRTIIIGGSRRMLLWDDLRPQQRLSIYDSGVDVAGSPDERARNLVSYRIGEMRAPALPEVEALRRVVEEFAGAIRQERTPATDGNAGLRVLEVLDAIGVSRSEAGRDVPVMTSVPRAVH